LGRFGAKSGKGDKRDPQPQMLELKSQCVMPGEDIRVFRVVEAKFGVWGEKGANVGRAIEWQ
jgi:hypothetical protein